MTMAEKHEHPHKWRNRAWSHEPVHVPAARRRGPVHQPVTPPTTNVTSRLVPGVELRPYQVAGAEWLAARRAALLADEQGLGKTISALAALPAGAPVVVVCPAVAIGVWVRHADWRTDLAPAVAATRASWSWPLPGQVLVTSYERLPGWLECRGVGRVSLS